MDLMFFKVCNFIYYLLSSYFMYDVLKDVVFLRFRNILGIKIIFKFEYV